MPLQRPSSRWFAQRTLARIRPLALLLTALTICVWTPRGMEAQGVTTSAMNGFITSDNGKPLEDAQVVAVHLPSGTEYRGTARAGGAYSLLNMRVGWMKNQGIRNTRETSVAKWYATDHSVQAALEAIQIHGAYGFSDEYPVERYLRNSKGAVIYEGTSEIHQLMQADYALGFREDKPLRCELPAYDAEFWQSEPELA